MVFCKRVFFMFLLMLSLDAAALEIKARVVFVTDGDTFITYNTSQLVRLWGVDAPELDQPWGHAAKSALIALTHNRHVVIEQKGLSYNRVVGKVRRGKIDVGLELIKMGLAWWTPHFAPDQQEYAEAEAEARKAKRGLWSEAKPVSPDEWRRLRKIKKSKTETANENQLPSVQAGL